MSDHETLRFVVHHHVGHGPEHWDLMLEEPDALATWQLDRPPSMSGDAPIPAVRIEDHRKAFLTYEGPISGQRGEVARHEVGTYVTLDRSDDAWRFVLEGKRLEGEFVLRRCGGRGHRWTLHCGGER